jgi:hypothetical protein
MFTNNYIMLTGNLLHICEQFVFFVYFVNRTILSGKKRNLPRIKLYRFLRMLFFSVLNFLYKVLVYNVPAIVLISIIEIIFRLYFNL